MPKIRYTQGILVARKVLACLEKKITKQQAKGSYLDSWSNCREQGHCLHYWNAKDSCFQRLALIAEHRSSDCILVILGPSREFDMQTNQPSEELYYATRKLFNCGDYKGAAKYILDEVYNGWTEETAAKLKPIEDKRKQEMENWKKKRTSGATQQTKQEEGIIIKPRENLVVDINSEMATLWGQQIPVAELKVSVERMKKIIDRHKYSP